MKLSYLSSILSFFLIVFSNSINAQQDTTKLPFAIANEKKLSEEDLANKKEGVYVTGIPDISIDPINGFGYGGEASIYFNGKRSDPFFAYTAYRQKLDIALFNTTKSQREIMLKYDVPYIFNSKWRLRVELGYESNPNLLYFGINDQTLQPLSIYPNIDTTHKELTNLTYQQYEAGLALIGAPHYNQYNKREYILNVSGERGFLENTLRLLVGYELANVNISTFGNRAKLANDIQNDKQVLGDGRYWVSIFQGGAIYDTRDLETDPSQGIFAELTNELSLKPLGSAFSFNKTFGHFNYYHKLFPNVFKKLVFAGRVAAGYTAGNAPFFEYQDQWSSEGSIEGLGGGYTLRGFKQGRFLGRVMTFNNFELRYRFTQFSVLKQHIALSAVPFTDIGGVWNQIQDLTQAHHLKISEGLGLRIAWNVNTILRFDYAISKEDRQFFFNLGHCF